MEEMKNTGFMESRTRIVEELLAKTAFKDSLRLVLKDIDPRAGSQLVHAIMGTDIEVPLAVAGALPSMANLFINAGMEFVMHVRGKFPPPLLAGFVESLLQDIDRQTLARLIAEVTELGHDLAPAFKAFVKALNETPSEGKEVG